MSEDYQGDYLTARNKIQNARDWRGTANVSFGDSTHEFAIRLLNEKELQRVKSSLPIAELQEYMGDDGAQPESQERLLELQQKEELTDEEENELQQLTREVGKQNGQIESAFGEEAYDALMWAGEKAIEPTDNDVNDIISASMEIQQEILGEIPQGDETRFKELLKEDMVEQIEDQPYPIKLNVGLQAFMETVRVLGNGLSQAD